MLAIKKTLSICSVSACLFVLMGTQASLAMKQQIFDDYTSGRIQEMATYDENTATSYHHDFDSDDYHIEKCSKYQKYLDKLKNLSPKEQVALENEINEDHNIRVNLQALEQFCQYQNSEAWKMRQYLRKVYAKFEFCENEEDRKNKCIDLKKFTQHSFVKRIYTPYIDGKIHGLQRTYIVKGKERKLVEVNNYYKGSLDGYSFTYDLQGRVQTKNHYHFGMLNGLCYQYHENGKVYKETPYVKGKKHGIEKEYSKAGILISEISFYNGIHNGIYNIYNQDGNKICEAIYLDGQLNGLMRRFYSNGIISAEINFEKNIAQGVNKTYYTNGNIKTKSMLVNNQKEGDTYSYYQDGSVYQHCIAKEGLLHGKCLTFYPNSTQVKVKNYFVNGLKEGSSTTYAEDGTLESEVKYISGKREGKATYYKAGKPYIQINFVSDSSSTGKCLSDNRSLSFQEINDFLMKKTLLECAVPTISKE